MRKSASKPKKISWKTLLTYKRLFYSTLKKEPRSYPKAGAVSFEKRYPVHIAFLKRRRRWINVFADVGCALPIGAPTTVDAKQALGKNSTVYAVDLQGLRSKVKKKFMLKGIKPLEGIKPLIHSIVERPLKFQCDAIRFANVSYHMTQSDRRRALVNIWKNLRQGGYLLGATVRGGGRDFEFVLRKKGKGFELVLPKSIKDLETPLGKKWARKP